MYHGSSQGVDERMINVHYYNYLSVAERWVRPENMEGKSLKMTASVLKQDHNK